MVHENGKIRELLEMDKRNFHNKEKKLFHKRYVKLPQLTEFKLHYSVKYTKDIDEFLLSC